MAGNKTFTIIKPTAVKNGHTGIILAKIQEAGFEVKALKMMQFTKEQAKSFYKIHENRPFYESLVSFMTSGPVVVAILQKENAVQAYRDYIGATDPSKAADGTVRKIYGTSMQANAVHGSDSDQNAKKECSFIFSGLETF